MTLYRCHLAVHAYTMTPLVGPQYVGKHTIEVLALERADGTVTWLREWRAGDDAWR